MEELLPITYINDFLFCPRSLYYGNIFRRSRSDDTFQQTPQKSGKAAHRTVDTDTYSTRKTILSGTMVYCEEFRLIGRIDLYDTATGTLTERKYSVSAVWEGFRLQLYAQCFALREMGHHPRTLRLHSVKDNRLHPVDLPGEPDRARLRQILAQMRAYRLDQPFEPNPKKCAACIYRGLCDLCAKAPDE